MKIEMSMCQRLLSLRYTVSPQVARNLRNLLLIQFEGELLDEVPSDEMEQLIAAAKCGSHPFARQ